MDETLVDLRQKLADTDFKLQGVLLRLELCEKYLNRIMSPLPHLDSHHSPLPHLDSHHSPLPHLDSHHSPLPHLDSHHSPLPHLDSHHSPLPHLDSLHKYLSHDSPLPSPSSQFVPSLPSPCRTQPHPSQHSHSRRFSNLQVRENSLDSKSFGMIKRSILINSQEIEEMRERVKELEKDFTVRIEGLEEGVQILTRLSHMVHNKLDAKHSADRPSKDYDRHRLIDKYRTKNYTTPNHPLDKYL